MKSQFKIWMIALLFLPVLLCAESKTGVVDGDNTDVPVIFTSAYDTSYTICAKPRDNSGWKFTDKLTISGYNGWYKDSISETGASASCEKITEGGVDIKTVWVDAATVFDITLIGEMYRQGGAGGDLVIWSVTGSGGGTCNATVENASEFIALGTSKTFKYMINGAAAPNGLWWDSSKATAITSSNYSGEGATYSFSCDTAGEYTITAARNGIGDMSSSGIAYNIGVKSVSAGTIKSETASPGSSETVYAFVGGEDFDITASPDDGTSDPDDIWPDDYPKWFIGTQASTSGDSTLSFDTSASLGSYIVKACCGENFYKSIIITLLSTSDIKLKTVNFNGTGNYTIKKQGTDSWSNDTYADSGNVSISYAEWQDSNLDGTPDVNEPVCYKMGEFPKMSAVISISSQYPSVDTPAKLRVKNGSNVILTKNINISTSGTDTTISDLSWNEPLESKVDNKTYTLTWSISVDGGNNYTDIATTSVQFFVVYGTPSGDLTAKRLNFCTNLATGKSTKAAIGDVVGPNAVSDDRFGSYSIYGSNPLATAWEVLDGKKSNCVTLSTCMKYQLDLLGASGAVVCCVYARHTSWTGLSNTKMPPKDLYMEYTSEGDFLGMWLGSGTYYFFNRYEGCCVFEGKWWKGGYGAAETSAYNVLMNVTSPNTSGATVEHQCWDTDNYTAVSYPSGTP